MAAHFHNPNPATSAEQYGLALAVATGKARHKSMPKDVAKEMIRHTPPELRSKYAKELAAKRAGMAGYQNPQTIYRGIAIDYDPEEKLTDLGRSKFHALVMEGLYDPWLVPMLGSFKTLREAKKAIDRDQHSRGKNPLDFDEQKIRRMVAAITGQYTIEDWAGVALYGADLTVDQITEAEWDDPFVHRDALRDAIVRESGKYVASYDAAKAILEAGKKENPALLQNNPLSLSIVQAAAGAGEASGREWGKEHDKTLSVNKIGHEFHEWLKYRKPTMPELQKLSAEDRGQLWGTFVRGWRQGFGGRRHNPDDHGQIPERPDTYVAEIRLFALQFFGAGHGYRTTIQSARSRVKKWKAERSHTTDTTFYESAIRLYEQMKRSGMTKEEARKAHDELMEQIYPSRRNSANPAMLQTRGSGWIQESYETGSREIRQRASQLRKLGYRVTSSNLGHQTTSSGSVKVTLLDIRPKSGDTYLENWPPPSPAEENPSSSELRAGTDPSGHDLTAAGYYKLRGGLTRKQAEREHKKLMQESRKLIAMGGRGNYADAIMRSETHVGRGDEYHHTVPWAIWIKPISENPAVADSSAARELAMFVENDADLYRQQETPINKNLATKKAKGIYHHEGAVKLFGHLMESGAKKYVKEMGSPGDQWHEMFNTATRKEAAEDFAKHFETEYNLGNYDHLLPKKYQKEVGAATAKRAANPNRPYSMNPMSLAERHAMRNEWREYRTPQHPNPEERGLYLWNGPAFRVKAAQSFLSRHGVRTKISLRGRDGELYATATPEGNLDKASHRGKDLLQQWVASKPESYWDKPTRNPEDGETDDERRAADLYEDFHGRPPDTTEDITEPEISHDAYASLGRLTQLKVATLSNKDSEINFEYADDEEPIMVSSSPDRKQIYFIKGDQSLDLDELAMSGDEWFRDKMVIGVCYELTYETKKSFEKFRLTDFFHYLGEESGVQPLLIYDTLNKKFSIAGGQYEVKDIGIVN